MQDIRKLKSLYQINVEFQRETKISKFVLLIKGDTRSQSSRVRRGGRFQLPRPERLQFQSQMTTFSQNKNLKNIKFKKNIRVKLFILQRLYLSFPHLTI